MSKLAINGSSIGAIQKDLTIALSNIVTVKDLARLTFGRCWPSAADEEWYSPKRPSSTVAVNELNTKVSAFFP